MQSFAAVPRTNEYEGKALNVEEPRKRTSGRSTEKQLERPIDILIKNFLTTDRAAEPINRKLCSVITPKISSLITNIPDDYEWRPLVDPCDIWKMLESLSTNKATGSGGIGYRMNL